MLDETHQLQHNERGIVDTMFLQPEDVVDCKCFYVDIKMGNGLY